MRHVLAANEGTPTSARAADARSRADFPFAGIVGESRAIRSTIDYVRRIANGDATTVLFVGAAGTGKNLFARAFHYAGKHAHQPFLGVDCRSTSDAMLEAELFGYEVGAFAGATERKLGLLELAGTGSVFIDDLGSFPQRLQPKLFRALTDRRVRRLGGREEYAVECSVLGTSNRPLEELVAEGVFRKDLFEVLGGTRISLPTLSERGNDVLLLAQHFLSEIEKEQGLVPMALAQDAVQELIDYGWPGNVRELRATMQQAVQVANGPFVHAEHLSIQHRATCPMLAHRHSFEISVPGGGRPLRDIEAEAIRSTLGMTTGNQAAAARILGISRPTLARKVREYGLSEYTNLSASGRAV